MPYQNHFSLADNYIQHLDVAFGAVTDPFIQSRYVGFVAVSAATVFELAIKDIFCSFGARKHKVLGNFTSIYFERINGRIRHNDIVGTYLRFCGEKYTRRFSKKLEEAERAELQSTRKSIIAAYRNVITWRNQFAHEGTIPNNATYEEVKRSYALGSKVIHCLADSLVR